MNRSETIGALAEALAKAQAVMEGASKDVTNPHFRSKYADLASIRAACIGPLSANGLAVAQFPHAEGPKVTVRTILLHTSGEFLEGECSAMAKDDGPQAIGSVITYLRRYALAAIAGVAPEDDDAEAAEGRTAHAPTSAVAPSSGPRSGHPSVPNGGNSGDFMHHVKVQAVKSGRASADSEIVTEHGEAFLCYDKKTTTAAKDAARDGLPVDLTLARSASGNRYIKSLKRAEPKPAEPELAGPIDASAIPF